MNKDMIPVLTLVVIVFIIGFFVVSNQNKQERTAAVPSDSTVLNYATSAADTSETEETQTTMKDTKGSSTGQENGQKMVIDEAKKYTAVLNTTEGTIKVELTAKQTPITVNNFVALAKKGFYNDTIFHRVIKGFMIQGGDPTGTGAGGPGYQFEDEYFEGEYTRGTIAMANAGPDTNGSQFFIMHADYALPKNYVIFGKVSEGLDVVDKIATAKTSAGSSMGENSKPVNPVTITSVEIVEE